MKIYRDLTYLSVDPENINKLLRAVAKQLPDYWHPVEADQSVARMLAKDAVVYLFERENRNGLPKALLGVLVRPGKAEVVNITSEEVDTVDESQYNAILSEFASVADGLARSLECSMLTNGETADLQPWLSQKGIEALHIFSKAANKRTGSAHPMDAARWYAFLIQAHREDSNLPGGTLGEYLVNDLGWPDEQAQKLMIEYEEARALLSAFDAA